MQRMTFALACKRNRTLQECRDRDQEQALALWLASKGEGEPELDSFADAVMDTAPDKYALLLSSGGTANAYAVARFFEVLNEAQIATPFERRELARKAWDRFAERAEKADKVMYGLGFDQAEAWECTREFRTDRNVRHSMERIAEMAGRIFAQLQRAKAEQVCAMPEELHSVELGSDLMRLLPSELMHLGQPTEIRLLENIANHRALQWEYRGDGEAGRGPLAICDDESGSMNAKRGEWMKAATIALTRAAWEDNRPVVCIHWSTGVAVTELRPGDHKAMLAMIDHWFGGGNDAALALDNAADEIDRLARKGDKGGDAVLITDGVEEIEQKHIKALDKLEKLGAKLYTVAIEEPIERSNPLRARAEAYVPIGGAELHEGEIGAMKGAVL